MAPGKKRYIPDPGRHKLYEEKRRRYEEVAGIRYGARQL